METKKRKIGLLRLIEIAGSKKWWLISSILLAIGSAVALFVPYIAVYSILKELALHATTPQLINRELILGWGYRSLAAVCIFGVLLYAAFMLSHIAAFTILYELRMALSRKLVRLPLGFFSKRASGEIKKIMSEDVERIELFVAHHIPDVATAVVFPLLVLAYLFVTDWQLALVVLLVFLGAILIQSSILFTGKSREQYAAHQSALGRMNASIVEYVRGIQVVKVFSRSTDIFERLQNDIVAFRDHAIGLTQDFSRIYTGYLTLLSSTLLFLVPISVVLLVKAPSYPAFIPTVLLFLILGGGMFFPLLKLMFMGSMMNQNSIGVSLIDDILGKQEISEPETPQKPLNASIEFCSVSFAYNETPVLREISFCAEPGTVTALVGPSGAGKTTVALLTARFWDVTAGEIRIGGVPLRNIGTEELMRQVAFVFQDSMLFFDTIEENIRMGNRTASREEVIRAAQAAHCHEFIQHLEQGYDTLVGEGGTYLSGGEQQRIALARALLKDAPIIILDEATAYADPENEGKILDSFSKLIRGKTVLVIAHRLSTITSADRILVIESGKIAEQGCHDDLLSHNGLYHRMWQTYTQSRQWVLAQDRGAIQP